MKEEKKKKDLSFPKREWVAGLTGSKILPWFGAGTTRLYHLRTESRWTVFIRNNLLLYIWENIVPEWVKLICWTQTWPALLPPLFFLFLGGIGTLGSRAVSLAPLKSQAQKKSKEQKLKIALHISGTQKVPECSLFTLTETYTNCFLGRHSEWKESYSSIVHPCLYRGLCYTSLKAYHSLLMPFF